VITGSLPPDVGLYLSVASSVPSRIGTWMVSQTTPGKPGLVTGAAFAASATTCAATAARMNLALMGPPPRALENGLPTGALMPACAFGSQERVRWRPLRVERARSQGVTRCA